MSHADAISTVVLDDVAGAPRPPWSVSAAFRGLTRELELPRTRFHDLRHAHATQLLGAGVHPKAVSERLGHSSISFTMDVYSAVIRRWDGRPPTPPSRCSAGSAGHNLATSSALPVRREGRSCW
jgi:integrase